MQRYIKTGLTTALFTLGLASLIAANSTGAIAGPSDDPVGPPRLVADLSDKILYLHAGDSVEKMYDISDGTDDYPTPQGSFTIRKLAWNPSWRPPDSEWAKNKSAKGPGESGNPMKVVKIFFKEPDYYIHGTGNVASLGSADSHGCLRMSSDDVTEIGRWVLEHGGEWKGENWFMRILHLRRQEKVIYLTKPLSISVVE